MRRRLVAVAGTVILALGGVVGSASAHPVGEPGTPNCHGQRVSHGSSDHGLTPKERAAILTEFINTPNLPPPAQNFANFIISLFGNEVSVQEFHEFVRLNCADVA